MPRTNHRYVFALVAGAAVAVSARAEAQDQQVLVPDVLLLVDTSGSMGLTSIRDPNNPREYAAPRCGPMGSPKPVDPGATDLNGASTPPDRWMMLVNVLTGKVKDMACVAQDRSAPEFLGEYSLGTTTPPGPIAPADYRYFMSYNRLVSAPKVGQACTPAPSWDITVRQRLMDNALDWPVTKTASPILWRELAAGYNNPKTCAFAPQQDDGLIDQFKLLARFGLMTFDPVPSYVDGGVTRPGIGIDPGTKKAYYTGGVGGTWSYFKDWLLGTTADAATGKPGGCNQLPALIEVGARNPAAPPWEGRMIGFGNPNANAVDIGTSNSRVEQALLAMRPFGATPIAGMLEDAKHYLLQDATKPTSPTDITYWGGATDPMFSTTPGKGCRKRFVILLTDGGPNLDLRPDCQLTINGIAGKCPYQLPTKTVEDLAASNVKTYAIGFAVTSPSAGGSKTCTELLAKQNGNDPCAALAACTSSTCPADRKCAYGYCLKTPDDETLASCCTVKAIAEKGGTQTPFFAEDFGSLYSAFAKILTSIVSETSSRSTPVFAAGSAQYTGNSEVAGTRFLTSFQPQLGDLFQGNLERERYKCTLGGGGQLKPELQSFDTALGDSLGKTVNDNRTTRTLYTVVGEVDVQSRIQSSRSIRPLYTLGAGTGDRLGQYGISAGDPQSNLVGAPGNAKAFPPMVDPRALLGDRTCAVGAKCCFETKSQPIPDPVQCRDRFLDLELGFKSSNPDIVFQRQSAFGAIWHSTPVVVGPPQESLRDETYIQFQRRFGKRPPVMYAATTDGQLHAFDISKLSDKLSELWSFIPPAVLPMLEGQFRSWYSAEPQFLLDGPVVARDVVGSAMPANKRFLSRTRAQAKASSARWYTVIVGSFGAYGGYYALDVSWPEPNSATIPPAGYVKGPRFLWQLTTDVNGQPLFGGQAGTPSIATLFFTMPGEAEPAEHAVAILPGGLGGQRVEAPVNVTFDASAVDPKVTARTRTRSYMPVDGSDASVRTLGGARSVTVVRLDTGEVIRTFRFGKTGAQPVKVDKQAPDGLYDAKLITSAPFDAPIGGHLVSSPGGAGSVSDRAFVGDAEGHLWRIDLSSTKPADWSADMFFDGYPAAAFGKMAFDWKDGQPIQTAPVVSTDLLGRVTVAFSTGDQSHPILPQGEHLVWSLTDTIQGTKHVSLANWFLGSTNGVNPPAQNPDRFRNGERVTGPMNLFNSVLYFTTYDPSSASQDSCQAGNSYLWAVDYATAGDDASKKNITPVSPDIGPVPQLDPNPPPDDPIKPVPGTPPKDFRRYITLGSGSIAFGVGVAQKPTCFQGVTEQMDSLFGTGTHFSMQNVTPGQYQLVIQAGKSTGGGPQTKVTTRNLAPPPGGVIINSWSSIVE
jgi:type IV pilus assembly protein PilY1